VPRLILLHNIHGVDIDPRATQIARLTLWLRAQRAWQEQGVEVAARPAITRSNVVCAEPMPGERELLADFVDQQFPEAERGLVQQLLEVIFDKMQLAGEAGSLLKIEEEIRDAIDQARREWKKLAIQQQDLFSAAELAALGQVGSSLNTDLQSLTKDFWIDIEERIYAALRHYAEKAETGGGFQRRFFAEDASQGFAFIDTCRKRYDVALMNPPFGDVSEGSKDYIFEQHTREKTELGACFVTRISQLLDTNSSLGIISSRTFLFAESFQEWRVLNLRNLSLCADLGFGVLDALVETAAFVLSVRSTQVASFVALTNSPDKGFDLSTTVREVCTPDTKNHRLYERHKSTFSDLGTEWFYYWLSERLLTKAKSLSAKQTGLLAKPGLQTCDNFRFVRLAWEVPKDSQFQQTWFRLSKGGEYQPFWADVHLVALWRDNGLEMKQFIENSYESWSKQIPSVNLYFLPGLTYSERTTSSLSLRIFPSGCLFDKQGPFVGYPAGSNQSSNLLVFLGISYCYLFKALVESQVGLRDATEAGSPARHYMPSMIERLPLPLIPHEEKQIVDWASASIKLHREFAALDTSDSMHRGLQDLGGSDSLLSFQNKLGKNFTNDMQHLYKGLAFSEIILSRSFNITKAQGRKLEGVFGPQFALEDPNQPQPNADDVAALLRKSEADLVQEAISRVGYFSSILKQSFVANRNVELAAICLAKSPVEILQQVKSFDWLIPIFELGQNVFDFWVGCAFGRWDIRYAMGGQGAPELPDPFAPLPVCPPGQLQNAHGLPARPEDVPPSYPVSIPWDGILVDDPNHRLDLERRIREVIEIIWTGKKGDATAESIEHEACYILGVKMVREYFRKPTGFFSNHLSRYSKSRRQAPIYWQLSAGGGSYSAWLYYHRFTQDTLYRVLGDFVEIRIQEAEREQFELESQVGLSGDAASLLQGLQTLLQDLRVFKSELELVAPLWNPNLNDGVIINHAILWRITPFTPWQKKCKECWDKLVKGDYDWAHLAFHLWPERVIRKCTTDRSLAIAHGLEERLWQETSKGNWLQHQVSEAELQALLAEYSKPAVQNALERFLAASPPVAAARTRAPRAAKSSSTGATRRPRGLAPEVDAETSRQTLLVLTASPVEGLGRNAIAELLDVEAASLTAVIKQLKEGGQIEQLGAARGAKYRLTEQGRAMVERGEES
jgi:predicted RNA methylase